MDSSHHLPAGIRCANAETGQMPGKQAVKNFEIFFQYDSGCHTRSDRTAGRWFQPSLREQGQGRE